MLCQASKTIGLAVGLSISFSLLGAQTAQAARSFDFAFTDQNGNAGSGSFSINNTFTKIEIFPDTFYSEEWFPLIDFRLDYLGQSRTDPVSSKYIEFQIVPSSSHYLDYGSFAKTVEFSWADQGFGFLINAEKEERSRFSYIFDPSTTQVVYLNNATITERNSESIPEPGTIAGLLLAGSGLLSVRRKQKNSTTIT